jgi:O-antigen/teichoic acid export membrane protein
LIGNLALPGNVEVFTQVFLILLCSTAVSAPIALGYSPYLSEKANTRVTLYLALITAGTNIALNVLLIPRYGLIGCAIATAASYVFGLCYLGLVMHKSYGISPVPAFLSVLPLILYVVAYLTFSSSLIALGVFLVAIVVFAVLRGRSLVTSYKFFSNYLKGFIGNRSS